MQQTQVKDEMGHAAFTIYDSSLKKKYKTFNGKLGGKIDAVYLETLKKF